MIAVMVDRGKRKMGVGKGDEYHRRKGKRREREGRRKGGGGDSCVCKAKGGFDSLLLREGRGARRLLGKETEDFLHSLPFEQETTERQMKRTAHPVF